MLVGIECAFDLELIAPQLALFEVPAGHDENGWLRHLETAGDHYGPPAQAPRVHAQN